MMMKTEEARSPQLPRNARVAVIAGSGRLPVEVADGLAAAGFSPLIVLIKGEINVLPRLLAFQHETLDVNDFVRLADIFRRHRVSHVVMAGGVSYRPAWHRLRPSLRLLSILRRVLIALARGDNALLSFLISELELEGIKVVGVHDVVPGLLAKAGVLTRASPSWADRRDIAAALEAALMVGSLDIGQGAIAIGGRVVALEGVEGTDGLLERTRDLRTHGRLAGRAGGVLVKAAKPGQELRVDLPAIGPQTVTAAHAAGLSGIGIEAERSLVLDRIETVRRADALGLFIVGLPPASAPAR